MGFIPGENLSDAIGDLERIGRHELSGIVVADNGTGDLLGISTALPDEKLRPSEQRDLINSLGPSAEYVGVIDPDKARERAAKLKDLLRATDLVIPIKLSVISRKPTGAYGRFFNSAKYNAEGSISTSFSDSKKGAAVKVVFSRPPGIKPVKVRVGENKDSLDTLSDALRLEEAVRKALEKSGRL
jgi:hypothetical protein